MSGETPRGPLAGVRVLDLTTVLSGPYCTYLLAQLGAEVTKVEPPQGDVVRRIPPGRHPLMGGIFLNINQNKGGVPLDLHSEQGQETLRGLALNADVLVHNMRPRAAERLGLTYDGLRRLNPRMVLCHIWGFGRKGPYAGLPAYDDTIQAACGLAYLQRDGDGRPQYMASGIADKVAGMFAALAIVAALYERGHSGVGQEIEVPMFECLASFTLAEHIGGRAFDPPEGPAVYERVLPSVRRPFRTRDGFLSAVVYTDEQWRRFARVCGRQDLLADEGLATYEGRARNYTRVYAMMEEIFASRTTDEWLRLLREADIPAMPVLATEDLFSDEHLRAVGFFKALHHPTEGRLTLPVFPVLFSRTAAREPGPAPPLAPPSPTSPHRGGDPDA
jgi:crotonobetainyl-CoA:carnitine CoA-transferase CaiB-like acyl-CoA transferase